MKDMYEVVKSRHSVRRYKDKSTIINQQKFKFELKNNNEVILKTSGLGPCTKIDLGIVKYHFEIGAGKENFIWA